MHVYGQPIPEGFIPLSVEVEPIEGVRPREALLPSPRPFRIEGLSEEFFVYEDRVRVIVPITFEVAERDQELGVKVSYQTCSETECWPPTTWKFSLPVKVAESHAGPVEAMRRGNGAILFAADVFDILS